LDCYLPIQLVPITTSYPWQGVLKPIQFYVTMFVSEF
jgi:hypothetical protein